MIITERTEMIKRALSYYEFKLNELFFSEKEEDNTINILLREDINTNKKKIREPHMLLSTSIGDWREEMRQYRDVLCDALINYIADLESSKKSVSEKLAGVNLSFHNIDKEIYLAKEAKTELCK